MNELFNSIIDNSLQSTIDIGDLIICTLVSIALGVCIALFYMYRNTYSKNFVTTLVLLPTMVQAIIMLVNGNLGTGVAVMGTFTLVRFRSVPGTSKEISSIFFAMAIGLATGMGYIGVAITFTAIIGIVSILLNIIPFADGKDNIKELKVVIPENLDYTEIFNDLFDTYTKKARLTKVKTTNLGSLYQLFYEIELKDIKAEKSLIDEIRCRNGNLNIVCGRGITVKEQL